MDIAIASDFLNRILSLSWFSNISGSEYYKYLQYLPLFLIGFALALILTPIIGEIALKHDITYKPGIRKNHKDFDNPEKALHQGITPALGGLAVTIPILLAILFFFKLDSFTIPIILAMLVLMVGSALDDIFNLPARTQLTYQILAALIISFSVINLTNLSFFNLNLDIYTWNFSILGLQQSLAFPGDIILFGWILICINAVKWTAGSPGIIEANSFTIFTLIFVIAIRYSSLFSSTVSIVAAGALLLFLIFAFPPQKIMSGSSGKTLYGFLICVFAIVADAKLSTTIMLLLIPLIDFAYVIVKRLLIYKPKNLIELLRINDTNHLHHQLLKLNLTRAQIVLLEMAMTLLIGSLAILSAGAVRYFALIFGAALGIGFIVLANIRASKHKAKTEKEESPESKYSY
jgi:UDP-N-acetylmuramyl pentapeptide phosphotransferase/UDP-N-acetylglucosamine-1-phosphate transferase